jgi:exopolysaccharide biosynthesis protein
MCFGPVLVENGVPSKIGWYPLGEINDDYSRAALCQKGDLHYLLVTANTEWPCSVTTDIFGFQKALLKFELDMAYTLDGGQTAVIAMNDKLINKVVYGYQRDISDIIYFATAIPSKD